MRKSNLLIATLVLQLLIVAGCSKSNEIADNAHQLAARQTDTIVYDLYGISRQLTIDKYCQQARSAAEKSDGDAAAAAVTGAVAEYDQITWLAREEYRKAREVGNISRSYILMQKGWWRVLYEQWKDAKAVYDEENAGETQSQTEETEAKVDVQTE